MGMWQVMDLESSQGNFTDIRKTLSRITSLGLGSSCWGCSGSCQCWGPAVPPHQNAPSPCSQAGLRHMKTPHCTHWQTAGRQGKRSVPSAPYSLGPTGGTWPCEDAGLQGQSLRQGSGTVVSCCSPSLQLEGLKDLGTSCFLPRWLTQRAFPLIREEWFPSPYFCANCTVYF